LGQENLGFMDLCDPQNIIILSPPSVPAISQDTTSPQHQYVVPTKSYKASMRQAEAIA